MVRFTKRNAVNLAVLVVAIFYAIFSGWALSSVIIVGIVSMAMMKVLWLGIDAICEVASMVRPAMDDALLTADRSPVLDTPMMSVYSCLSCGTRQAAWSLPRTCMCCHGDAAWLHKL